jgi:hypothetical protein
MTSHLRSTRPTRAARIAVMTSLVALAGVLTACADTDTGNRSGTSETASPAAATPSPTPTRSGPTVYGNVSVLFAMTTPDSKLPKEPVSYQLVVVAAGASEGRSYPVDARGDFALDLAPGAYELAFLDISSPDLAPQPVRVQLRATKRVMVQVPASGCIHGGRVPVVYARLPAVSEKAQRDLVKRASQNNKATYGLVYLPTGGIVITDDEASLSSDAPAAVDGCTSEPFTSVPR